jgi:NlpC/P60 family
MNKAFRLMLCPSLVVGWVFCAPSRANAQPNVANWIRSVNLMNPSRSDSAAVPRLPQLPEFPRQPFVDFRSRALPPFGLGTPHAPFPFLDDATPLLQGAIFKRLGIRYKFTGSDDRGYDCSGFVWRVFQEIGADFDRVAARTLWRQLPAAIGDETRRFGTLVFFNGVKHIGIVRDAETFYHSSRSQGVTLSTFSGYWGKRITGYRRSPFPLAPEAPKPIE